MPTTRDLSDPGPSPEPTPRERLLERRLRRLAAGQLASWACLAFLALSAFGGGQDRPPVRIPPLVQDEEEPAEETGESLMGEDGVLRVTRIETERIDVVEPHGRAALVLSGRRWMPGPRAGGAGYPPEVEPGREREAGLLFYDAAGNEVGALVAHGEEPAARLAFHRADEDEAVLLESGADARAGVAVWDRPTARAEWLDAVLEPARGAPDGDVSERLRAAAAEAGEDGVRRVFLGREGADTGLTLYDAEGRARARFAVEEDGEARLEILDAAGEVVASLP